MCSSYHLLTTISSRSRTDQDSPDEKKVDNNNRPTGARSLEINLNHNILSAAPYPEDKKTPAASTNTSLDLEKLIRRSEICSSPRHTSCEHSPKRPITTNSPQHPQSQQQHATSKDFAKANASHAKGGGPSYPSSESKRNSAKLSVPCSVGGGVSSLKRIAPAPRGGSAGVDRPLQCLETLAQKAGITFDEKGDVGNGGPTMEKSQSPAQPAPQQGGGQQVVAQHQPQQQPLQISQEQFQQLQQLQFQHQFGGNMVQVKQEFPQQQHGGGGPQQGGTIQISGEFVEHKLRTRPKLIQLALLIYSGSKATIRGEC